MENKTREEIIFGILLSLNQGNCGYVLPASYRIDIAINQYKELVEKGIIKE
jgi:hypothetical protein